MRHTDSVSLTNVSKNAALQPHQPTLAPPTSVPSVYSVAFLTAPPHKSQPTMKQLPSLPKSAKCRLHTNRHKISDRIYRIYRIRKSAYNILSILFIPSTTPATHYDYGTCRQPAKPPSQPKICVNPCKSVSEKEYAQKAPRFGLFHIHTPPGFGLFSKCIKTRRSATSPTNSRNHNLCVPLCPLWFLNCPTSAHSASSAV